MATGAASQLAAHTHVHCGLRFVVAPLLWLAIIEAAGIVVRGTLRRSGEASGPLRTWLRPGSPAERSGVLTVPLGLAVITTGIASQHNSFPAPVALSGLALAWATCLVLLPRFIASARAPARASARAPHAGAGGLDGSWFLAPAALLGAAIATAACARRSGAAVKGPLQWLALVAAASGLASYWVVLIAAAAHAKRCSLRGSDRVLWWISAGCGGLAAASAAAVLALRRGAWPTALTATLRWAMGVTWSVAAVLLALIVAESVRNMAPRVVLIARSWSHWHLLEIDFRRAAPWPPAFSTAVFALGSLGAGEVLHAGAIITVGRTTAIAALVVWAITATWELERLSREVARARI